MKCVIVPAALAELHDAAAFYTASANLDLGLAFLAEFEHGVDTILAHPGVGAMFRGTSRRYLLRRFPYSIIYQATPEAVRIIAVAHQRRRPSYWAGRK